MEWRKIVCKSEWGGGCVEGHSEFARTEKAQGVESDAPVLLDLVIEAVRPPVIREEDNGHGLAIVVELEPAAAHGVQNGGIVDHLDGNLPRLGPQNQVSVRRGTMTTDPGREKKGREEWMRNWMLVRSVQVHLTRMDLQRRERRHPLCQHPSESPPHLTPPCPCQPESVASHSTFPA